MNTGPRTRCFLGKEQPIFIIHQAIFSSNEKPPVHCLHARLFVYSMCLFLTKHFQEKNNCRCSIRRLLHAALFRHEMAKHRSLPGRPIAHRLRSGRRSAYLLFRSNRRRSVEECGWRNFMVPGFRYRFSFFFRGCHSRCAFRSEYYLRGPG